MTEATLTRHIQAALREAGAWVYKTHGSALTRAGVPDLLVCYQGRFIGLEVKGPRGVMEPRQLVEMAALVRAGGRALVVKSVEEALRALSEPNVVVMNHFTKSSASQNAER